MGDKSKKVCALISVCILYSIPVFVSNMMSETNKTGEIMEVYADDTIITDELFSNDIKLQKSIDTTNILTEKIADFSQRYTEVDKYFYVKNNTVIKISDDNTSDNLCKVVRGDYINCIGEDMYNSDGYYKVLVNGNEGYILTSDVTSEVLFKSVEKTVYIKNKTNVYDDSNKTNVVSELDMYHEARVIALNNELGLYELSTNDGIRYINIADASDDMLFNDDASIRYAKDSIYVHALPNDDGENIKKLNAFDEIQVVGCSLNWAKVLLPDDNYGYIRLDKITTECPKALKAVQSAHKMLGTPYVYGAASTSATDCSGLTLQCYRYAGISIPRTAATQNGCGIHVSLSEARPGDLITWSGSWDGRITHVGIYVGNDTFIHASCSKGVTTASVSSYKNNSQLVSVVRVTDN